MEATIISAIIGAACTVFVTLLLMAERNRNHKRDAVQEQMQKSQEQTQAYNAVNNCIRLEIESGEDDVERAHRKLNKMTAAKVNGELYEGKPINGELARQRDATSAAEEAFYKKKNRLGKVQKQLLNDYMSGKEIKKENYL